jgi:hypothetical protein
VQLRIHESYEYSYEYTRVGDARARGSEVWECLFKNMCVCMALNRHSHRARPGGGRDSCYAAAAICVSSCCCYICVLMLLLYMCPHAAAIYVSSCCCYICVLMLLLYMCPRSTRTATHETAAMLLRLYICVSSCCCYMCYSVLLLMRPHAGRSRVRILSTFPHTASYVSAYCY